MQSPTLHHLCITIKILENVIIKHLLILRAKWTVFFSELNLRLLDSVYLMEYFNIIEKH